MTRSIYASALSANVVDAARTAVAEQLPRHLPAVPEPPPEIRGLIARLVALDSAKQRAAESRVAASVPLQLPLPGTMPPRS